MRHLSFTSRSAPASAAGNSVLGSPPAGVTLTEVLMSLMIMSIGVSAVAVLFPISTLRSIQANQLTHAAIVKYNVEALLQSAPELLFDPDGNGNRQEHFRTLAMRNYVVDPLGFYTHIADGNNGYASMFGNDGTSPAGTLMRFGGGLRAMDGYTILHPLDPLFVNPPPLYAAALRLSALAISNQGDGWLTDFDTVPVTLIRNPAGAVIGVQLPAPPELDLSQQFTSELIVPGTAPSNYLIQDPELYRVVLYSGDGKRSQAFPLTRIDAATNQVFWSEDTDADGNGDHDFDVSGGFGGTGGMDSPADIRALPVEFYDPVLLDYSVSRVLLQSRRMNDFSWLLTVRRRSDGFVRNVDIVVQFNNGVAAETERLFEASFVKGTNVIGIRFPYRITAGDVTEPVFRKGKFVLDAQNARWYRIQDYKQRPLGNVGWSYPEYDAIVYTETEITDAAGEDQFSRFDSSGAVNLLLNGVLDPGQYDQLGNVEDPKTSNPTPPPLFSPVPEDEAYPGDNDGNLDFGLAMFPPGVIDIYPMGSMKMPSSL